MSLLEDQQNPTSQVSSGLISYPDAATPVAIATTERAAQREADTQAAQTQIDLRTQEAQRQADAHSDAVANLKLSLSSAYAKDMPPEEAAKYERLSKATGFDPALISTDPDVKAHSERLLRLSEIKPDTLAVLYPHTAKLLSNPQTAALSHDDSSALQHLEDAWANTWRSVGSGSLSLGAVALDIAAELGGMAGVLTTEQEAATLYKNDPEGLKRFREQSIPGALDRMARRLQEYSTATIKQMPESAKQRYQTLEYATTDMSKSALLSPVRMVGDALQSLPSSAALMLTAYFTKKAASSAASLASVKADELALTGAAKTEFVRQASVRAAERAATVSGAVGEGILGASVQTLQTAEQISKTDVSKSPVYLALLGQGYSPEAAAVKVKADTADQAGIIAGLVDAGVNAAAGKWIAAMFTGKSLGKAIVQGVAVESGTEMVQSGGEQFGVNLAIKKNIDEAQSLTRGVLENMIQGGVIGGLTGGTVAGLATWVDGKVQAEGQAENAAEFHRSMTALSQAASSAKLRERGPEHFKQFMQSMAGSTDLKDVFIDATTLQEVLAKATPEQQQVFAQEMPQVVVQIAETAGRDGVIAIPVEDYATHIAGKELDAAILPHLKGEEAGLTYAQAQEQVKAQTEEMLLEEAKSVLADQKTTEEFQTDAQQVYDTLLGRVEGAKRFSPDVNKKYAALQQAYFVTKAQRLGIKPSELLARFDVQVQAEPTSGVTLDQPASSGYGYRVRDAARKATLEAFAPESAKGLLRATDWAIFTEGDSTRIGEIKADLTAAGFPFIESPDGIRVANITREQALSVAQNYGHEYVTTREGRVYPDGYVSPALQVREGIVQVAEGRLPMGADRIGEVQVEAVYFSGKQEIVIPEKDGRISFYVDEGKGVFPEADVGAFRHETTLTNMYDAASNPLKLKGSGNDFEKAVVDAGFDGYYVKGGFGRQGVAVLLGDATKNVQVDLPVKAYNQTVVPTFYSQLAKAISAAPDKVFGKGENVANWVNANASKLGIKKAEVDAVGLVEWLQTRAKVTKADVVNFVEQNGVQVKDVIMGEDSRKLDFEEVESNDEGFSEMYEAEFEMKDGGKEKVGIAYAPGADAWWGFYRGEMVVEDVSREDAEDAAISAARNDMADSEPGASNTKFSSYQLPGGENYKELLLTLPVKKIRPHAYEVSEGRWATGKGNAIYPSKEMAENYGGMVDAPSFRSPHYDHPNILAHIRFNERTDVDGKRVLFLEEIQSDWGQKGKKEGFAEKQSKWPVEFSNGDVAYYLTQAEAQRVARERGGTATSAQEIKGTPSAPFVTDTKVWTALALKRMIRYAADKGFDKIAWTTGEQQAARYDLSKHVKSILVVREEGKFHIFARDLNGKNHDMGLREAGDLEEAIGKDLAKKVTEQKDRTYTYEGVDLSVGGEGMKGYYDQIVPQVANDILKKLGGGKVEDVSMPPIARDRGTGWESTEMQMVALPPTKQQGFTITPELRAKVTNEGQALFQKNRGTFNPDTLTISLLKDADLTTFLHETGHFFLEAEAALAADPSSTSDDFQKTLYWFGIPDLATWQQMSFEEKRPFHEQYARGFEAYLFEGKAPSAELRSIFASFKQWLLHVYRSLTNLNVELTDEVRGVFDRMLASDEAIFQTEQRHALTAALLQDMTPSEKAAYLALDGDASDDAMLELERRSMRDMQWLSNAKAKILKDIQKEAAGKRKEVRDQVYAEVMAEPINQARTFLRKGEMADPATGDLVKAEKGFRLNTTVLAEMYPETMLARPDLTKLRGMTSAEGLDPDVVATIFGFPSGDALVRSLIAEESPSEKIKGLTDQRMLEQYGELVDERAIEAAANEAVHNEARARFMATGLKALSKSELPAAQLVAAARDAAEQTIAAKKVRDVKPAQYLAAETRANKEVLKNAAKDVEKAKRAQRSALLNNRLAKAASSALEEVRKGVDRLNRLQRAAAQDNMRGEYLAQLNALLDRFDLRTGQTLKAIDANRMPLTDWLAAESERLSAVVPDLPDWILNEGNKTHYKDLTMEEFRGVVDAVKQLELLARREEKQYQEIRGMKFAEERQALLQRIWSFHPEAFGPDGEPLGMSPKFVKHFGDAITELGDKFAGEFLNAETIVNLLEGGEFGLAHESLLGRMSKMADWKATRLGEIYKAVAPSFKQYSLLERRDFGRKDIGAPIGMSLTRENALVVALLHGNAEGRDRLSNYGWDENTQEAIVGLLDERDMALAERIWSLFDNELWPELKALNDRTRGKSPPKVEAVPVMHKGKFYSGGYFRLKYDTNLDERAHRLDEGAAVKELLGGGLGMSAKTGQGASTERKQNVTMRPRLDLGVFSEAVSETVHDLAYREAVADTMRLLNDKGIQVAIKNAAGTPAYRALVTRVREIAAPPRNPVGFIEKTLTIARKNTIVTLMSGVNTALQNFTGFISAAARVHPGRLAKEIALFYSPKMAERYNFAMSQSEYMRNRHNSFERDLQNEIKKMTVNANIMPDTGAWLALMSAVDKGTSVPVWNAAFHDGMAKFENDRAGAVDYADHTVRQSQGSGRELDVAQIMSGHGGYGQLKRVFTMFYSYFNSQLGMLVRSGVVNKRLAASNPTMAAANFTKDFMLVFVLPALLTKAIFKGGEDKDPEEWLANYSRALAMYGMAMFPLVRDIGAFAWASFDHSVANYGFKVTPIQSAGEGVVKGAVSARDILAGEGDDRDLKNLIMGTSYSVGLPGKLISDTVLGTKAVIEGEAPPQAIVFGPPKK